MKAFKVALVLAAGLPLVGWSNRLTLGREWMRLHRTVVPDGTSIVVFRVRSARMLSVIGYTSGQERTLPSARTAAYHVMQLFPGADSVTGQGMSADGNEFHHTAVQQWWAWSGSSAVSRHFSGSYDPVRGRVVIEGRRYSLERGNLFVVRYDAQGRASVRQLPRTVNHDLCKVARTYRALLPSDPLVSQVLDDPSPPCPQQAVAVRTVRGAR